MESIKNISSQNQIINQYGLENKQIGFGAALRRDINSYSNKDVALVRISRIKAAVIIQ